MYRILMVDDDVKVLELNRKFFEKNNCVVEVASNGTQALELTKSFEPECILLDVMMEGMDGFTVCKKLRKITDVPILFLSGKVREDDKIQGFQCGADDYIEKPYSIKEVYVRIIANIKRRRALAAPTPKDSIKIPPLEIMMKEHKVLYFEDVLPFSNREYDMLLYMAKRPNEEITFEEIGNAVWGTYCNEDRRSIMVNISRLRKKIMDYTGVDNLIETVWSKGYKLVKKS